MCFSGSRETSCQRRSGTRVSVAVTPSQPMSFETSQDRAERVARTLDGGGCASVDD
jgi:hypothetical protein